MFILVLFGGLFLSAAYASFFARNRPASVIGAIVLFIILLKLVQITVDKSRRFTIHVDINGITISGKLYSWDTIRETAIIKKFNPKSPPDHYLILALNEKSAYECYPLGDFLSSDFGGFAMTLSKYIEYFKSLGTRDPTPKTSHTA